MYGLFKFVVIAFLVLCVGAVIAWLVSIVPFIMRRLQKDDPPREN